MYKKMLYVGMMLVIALSAGVAAADDGGTDTFEAVFHDGRINSTDLAASAVIYYMTDTVETVDADGVVNTTDVVTGVTVWGLDANSTGHLELYVTLDMIAEQMAATGQDFAVFEHNGFGLGYSTSGWFWVSGPDGYSFMWQA
jgi:predicted RecA/RadA family phage recombinase